LFFFFHCVYFLIIDFINVPVLDLFLVPTPPVIARSKATRQSRPIHGAGLLRLTARNDDGRHGGDAGVAPCDGGGGDVGDAFAPCNGKAATRCVPPTPVMTRRGGRFPRGGDSGDAGVPCDGGPGTRLDCRVATLLAMTRTRCGGGGTPFDLFISFHLNLYGLLFSYH
jgi:hypothetical protein